MAGGMPVRLAPVCMLAMVYAAPALSAPGKPAGLCFRAMEVGGESIDPSQCRADPWNLGGNADVLKLVSALKLDARRLAFRGCASMVFAAHPVGGIGADKYLITYSTRAGARDWLPVLAHELAHVRQMHTIADMQRLPTLQIELGADFLAGVLYRQIFQARSIMELQNNLELLARYGESTHGEPHQRNAAFRFGYYLKMEQLDHDYDQALQYFYDSFYRQLAQTIP